MRRDERADNGAGARRPAARAARRPSCAARRSSLAARRSVLAARRSARARVAACLFLLAAAALLCGALPPGRAGLAQSGESRQAASPRAQQPSPARRDAAEEVLPEDPDDLIKVDTDLILVDVTVTDTSGRPVRDLRAQDFRLYEDGVEREIAFFNVERRSGAQRPVAAVLAVDMSGSLAPEEMPRVADALRAFSERLDGRDSVFALMSFGMSARILQDFTDKREKLERAFEKLARERDVGASTHTFDAVDDAVRLLARRAPRTRGRVPVKRVVVVVTDGFPVGDTVSAPTVIERANAAEVSVYTVTIPSFSMALAARGGGPLPTPLDVSGLAEKTGGTNVYATGRDFGPLFKTLAEEVVSTYVLAFYPPPENRRDGRYRQIRVTSRPGLQIRQSRPGYKS
jgi:Ca-activated chloride channel homolog